jgi:hypothetical protein
MKKLFTSIFAAILIFFTVHAQISPYYTNAAVNDIVGKQSMVKTAAVINLVSNSVKGTINIKISNPNNSRYEISLYSTNGQKIPSILYDHPAGVSLKTMYVPSGVQGMYYLVVIGEGEKHSMKVFVQ